MLTFSMLSKLTPGKLVTELDIDIDGDFANLTYHFGEIPFDRIRRITGYLVGTLDRFNNAKKAEVEDRVKHSIAPDVEEIFMLRLDLSLTVN